MGGRDLVRYHRFVRAGGMVRYKENYNDFIITDKIENFLRLESNYELGPQNPGGVISRV